MTDAEFVLHQTNSERKRNAWGDRNKKRQGGKTVRFPSDYLTKKEREKLNGDVMMYDFKRPVDWESFKAFPHDIQQEYLDLLSEKFPGVLNQLISESLGANGSTMSVYMHAKGLKINKKTEPMSRREFMCTEAGVAWKKWHDDSGVEVNRQPVKAEKAEEATVDTPKAEDNVSGNQSQEVIKVDESSADKISALIAALAGTGAKLTIEITL